MPASYGMDGVTARRFETAATLVLFAEDGSVAFVQDALDGRFSTEIVEDPDFLFCGKPVEAVVWTHPRVTLRPDRRVRIERYELWDEDHKPLMWGDCQVVADPTTDLIVSGLRAEFISRPEGVS